VSPRRPLITNTGEDLPAQTAFSHAFFPSAGPWLTVWIGLETTLASSAMPAFRKGQAQRRAHAFRDDHAALCQRRDNAARLTVPCADDASGVAARPRWSERSE